MLHLIAFHTHTHTHVRTALVEGSAVAEAADNTTNTTDKY